MGFAETASGLVMRLCHSRRVDGLFVGVMGGRADNAVLRKVEDALAFIKQHDPSRYRTILKRIEAVWVRPLFGARAQFEVRSNRCSLDYEYAKSAGVHEIASSIVHEATHAHPCMLKLGYREEIRHRIELV